eukprot:COSAG06_NODE_1835_length_8257_cov_14.244300_3_plen_108_part_00
MASTFMVQALRGSVAFIIGSGAPSEFCHPRHPQTTMQSEQPVGGAQQQLIAAGHVVADGTHVARVAEALAEPDLARLRWVATGPSVRSDQVGRALVAAWPRSHTSKV